MNKQEEIREGMESFISDGVSQDLPTSFIVSEMLIYLHENGVVIQIIPPFNDRELTKEEQHYLAIGGKIVEPLVDGEEWISLKTP